MTQEDRQLLFKDLCSRLPYGVVVEIQLVNAPRAKYPVLKVLQSDMLCDFMQTIENVIHKPYLRSLSNMTEEEKEESEDVCVINYNEFEGGSTLFDEMGFDWLNKHHFDYRGLIGKGLAIEAPKEMYKQT